MSDVVIAGIGQTPVGEHWDISLRELAYDAIQAARADAGGLRPQAVFIGNMLAAQLSRQAHLGALIAEQAGLTGMEAATIEAGGASGGAALRAGYLVIASGQADVALVVGVEKITDQVGGTIEEALATGSDSDFEAVHGMTPTVQAALLMRRYQYEYQTPPDALAGFALLAHTNGVGNPHAMYQKPISLENYLRGGLVSDPLRLFDVAPYADGAAAIVLARADILPPKYPHPLVRVAASSVTTDMLALHDRPDPLEFRAARLSVERVCQRAHITPLQVDFFELFDAYTIYAALSLEAAGYARPGEGWRLAQDGQLSLQGSLPISTLGGLKARGNPGGATGVYQVVEAALQLRGQAGQNQVPEARRALVQSLGGPASTAVTHLLEVS